MERVIEIENREIEDEMDPLFEASCRYCHEEREGGREGGMVRRIKDDYENNGMIKR